MKILSILLSLSLPVLLWACGSKAENKTTESTTTARSVEGVVPVKLTPVTSVVRAEPVIASGLVSSAEEARLSFKVGGIINRMFADEGQTVRKGQLLATLDLTEIDAQVSQAQLASEKAERDFGRVQRLYGDTAATLEQLQNATTSQNVSKQALTIAQFNRSYAQIRASVDGTVTRKVANAGEYVAAGASVYLISGNRRSDWVVRVGVSDKDWARLQPGNRATVRLDAYPDQPFSGTISELAQAADPVNKLYEVEIRITPGTAKLAPGLFANVSLLPARSRSYAVVPVEAIVEGNGKDGFVYIPAGDREKVRKVAVQIGYLDGDKVLLTNGLSGVKEVITAGSAFLTEESRVVIK
ncbi:efflux RND transporter periplasmic adaptor subunit [Spirosoma utsteinense]|uniref:RND family efflux transporter MFP subunit n=1 Tax=Spirosoma utsteinense TaxID=2585773 RepID=A0ABR6W2W7_9BACT|nr:efflux RND transporter periplasmic adaptor subunit [Spirosoma utsteinense]MBC3784274.1 RND family efflux transporter MFP subunit [Spirosoma utsteinense]MBC3790929.1 RND family efflux transporter MFP subunit [Spirosoma utsteinense]